MAKAKHPKLRWERDLNGDWHTVPAQFLLLRLIDPEWGVYDAEERPLAYAAYSEQAKAIAQAFADAETLRGEGG